MKFPANKSHPIPAAFSHWILAVCMECFISTDSFVIYYTAVMGVFCHYPVESNRLYIVFYFISEYVSNKVKNLWWISGASVEVSLQKHIDPA